MDERTFRVAEVHFARRTSLRVLIQSQKAPGVKMKAIGITGMPGSGKNIIREVAGELGIPVIVMGDEIRAEAERRGLSPTTENLGNVMLQIRREEGQDVLAKRCAAKIRTLNSRLFVIDGLRSLHEVESFRVYFPGLSVVAIHASPKTRYLRLLKRGRSDDPKDWKEFIERDQRELSVGLGEVIATADYMIVNEGRKAQIRIRLKNLLEQLITND